MSDICVLQIMKPAKKDVKFSIRISAETKKDLQHLADNEKRNLSDYIRIELEKIVAEKKPKP